MIVWLFYNSNITNSNPRSQNENKKRKEKNYKFTIFNSDNK